MLQLLFRKWWVVLLQGILLIILSFYIFQHPVEVLAGISLWCGLLVLAAGLLGITAWLASDKAEREGMSLLWSILSAAFGLLMILKIIGHHENTDRDLRLVDAVNWAIPCPIGLGAKEPQLTWMDNVYCRRSIRGRGCHDGIPYWDRSGWREHAAGFAGFAHRPCPCPAIVRQENGGRQN